MDTKAASTDAEKKTKPNALLSVTTVDTSDAKEATSMKADIDASSQARTPKHANKTKDDDGSRPKDLGSRHDGERHPSSYPPGAWHPSGYPTGSFPFDGRMGGGGGAFQPRDRHSFAPPGNPMHVSPSSGRYYGPGPASYSNGPPPPRYPLGPYDPRYGNEYQRYDQYPPRHYNGPPPPPPPPPGYLAQSGSFDGSGRPPSWGAPPPSYPHGRPPLPSHHMNQEYYPPPRGPSHAGNSTFSRAVSSSFDRSIKSRDETHAASTMEISTAAMAQGAADNASFSEDASWKMLNQVHSVDEDEMQRRLQKRETPQARKEVAVNQPSSNSSSLTNSPTDGVEAKKPAVKESSKRTTSLDSLSSVASAQEPMETTGKAAPKQLSPSGSSGSLDLIKCASGSSALLLPSHQRNLSQFSFSGTDMAVSAKRPHDDEREDRNTAAKGSRELRKAPSEDGRPTKKGRMSSKDAKKKSSPLSITCSPPNSPAPENRKVESKMYQPQPMYPRKDHSPGYYDKGPSYSYSMDSASHVPREAVERHEAYPNLPLRPGSSSSSTITPMNVEATEIRNPPGVSQLPSWEIHGQDSFGATSTNGHPLMSSFSFPQDYPMLAASASGDMGGPPPPHPHGPPHGPSERGQGQALESRNQSFDGGHYHGSFARSDSMMSYENRSTQYDTRQPYQGSFPPHAPSWGSAASYPPPHGYPPYRGGYPAMMRNYSEDSGARASPPPGLGGMRPLPPNFQPPPDFRAPPSMVAKSGPKNTILTSPYHPSPKVGPYGWSKEEDDRLTDIMKKYKNPRDWEPIAKEHNRGRSAKECHERWIRYLKPGVRKGQWTDHEDAIVMEVVTTSSEQPFTRWSDLAQRLPGRVGKQIRDRWVNHLNPSINHLPFSREDDLLLWEGHKKLGKRWVEISTKYFNSSRSENHIKNRWYSASFKKFISNEFGPEAYSGKPRKESSPDKKKKPSSPRKRGSDQSQVEAV